MFSRISYFLFVLCESFSHNVGGTDSSPQTPPFIKNAKQRAGMRCKTVDFIKREGLKGN